MKVIYEELNDLKIFMSLFIIQDCFFYKETHDEVYQHLKAYEKDILIKELKKKKEEYLPNLRENICKNFFFMMMAFYLKYYLVKMQM